MCALVAPTAISAAVHAADAVIAGEPEAAVLEMIKASDLKSLRLQVLAAMRCIHILYDLGEMSRQRIVQGLVFRYLTMAKLVNEQANDPSTSHSAESKSVLWLMFSCWSHGLQHALYGGHQIYGSNETYVTVLSPSKRAEFVAAMIQTEVPEVRATFETIVCLHF